MGQMTWRMSDELLERVREQAHRQGRSLNEWVGAVLDAASDPATASDEGAQIRERLARAGLLADVGPRTQRPDEAAFKRARRSAGRGTSLSELVSRDRG